MKKINFDILKIQIVYLIIIIMLLIYLYIKSSTFVIFIISLFLITLSYSIYIFLRETKTNFIKLNQTSKAIKQAFKNDLVNIDIPMCMIKENKIIWENLLCKESLSKDEIKEVVFQFEQNSKKKSIYKDYGNGKKYKCIITKLNVEKEETYMIIFIDESKRFELECLLEDSSITSGIISIDNYEESLQGMEELEKSIIISKVDKAIKTWINENKGIIVNIEKDKYLILVKKQYIEKIKENKFDILEEIKQINIENPITISIGLSNNEKELNEKYEASGQALDIALGRGGDQVVIKKGNKFDFYGGLNESSGRVSKIKARTMATAINNIIIKSDVIYIMGHKNTDLDCLGSAIGIYKLCLMHEKKAYIIVDNKLSDGTKEMINRMTKLEEYKNAFITKDNLKKLNDDKYTLFVVDTHKPSYTVSKKMINEAENVIVIDHHRRGNEFIQDTILTYHELYASSACELVTELLMYIPGVKLSLDEAESLYSGILLDTKNYTFKTGVRTFEVSAYLRKYGIDINSVKKLFKVDFKSYIEKSEIIRNAEFINNNIAIAFCKNDSNITLPAQVADELLNIDKIDASFVICKIESVVMISGRSNGDISVQIILEKLGGGGHTTFAGVQLLGISVEQAKEKLLNVINEYIKS